MVFSQLLVVMIAAIGIAIFAERKGIQAPLLLAVVGLAASFIPGLERLELEPEIILTVVLPPLLFSAAREFSFDSFLRRLGSIGNLGVFLVIATTGFVGFVAAQLIPGITLPAAMVLAAVVSPPDAVTAVAVGRKLQLPERLMTVLKGESLINDAAALTLFTFAAASVTGAPLFTDAIGLYLAYSAFGGIVAGMLIGNVVAALQRSLDNPSLTTVLSVLVPFSSYLIAEELGASGVLAVVAAGFAMGHHAAELNYASRIQEGQFWRTVDSLLETFVFAYIGLQLRFVIDDAAEAGVDLGDLVLITLAVLAAVIGVRIAWVFATAMLSRWRYGRVSARMAQLPANHRFRRRPLSPPFSWRENLVISWTGMRGVVTLAAAAGIPLLTLAGEPFPGRPIIQAVAFGVTIGTLLLQGLTLPWLIGRLGISDPDEAARHAEQLAKADAIAREATIASVTAYRDASTDPARRQAAEAVLHRVKADGTSTRLFDNEAMIDLAREMSAARRLALIKAREERRIGDEVVREELEKMDFEQAVMANWTPDRR